MRLTASLIALATLAPLSTQAQEASSDLVVITATRTPTALWRLPARVEVIDRNAFEQQNLVTLTQAIGSDAVQSGGPGQQASLFLRGANSAHALALFDGVRLNDPSNPNDQYDFGLDTLGALERVEIVRGPESAIYGSDAIGGVVNLIPRRGGVGPLEPFLEASSGSFETWRGLLGASGSEGGLDYGVSAEAYDSAGYDLVPRRMATHTGDPDGARIETFTGSARQEFGDFALDGLVRVRDSHTEYDTFSGGPFFDLRADDPSLFADNTETLWRLGAESGAFRLSGGQVKNDRAETDSGFETNSAQATYSFVDARGHWTHGDSSLLAGLSLSLNAIDNAPQFSNPLSIAERQSAAYVIGRATLADHFDATASVRVDDYQRFGTHMTYGLGAVAHEGPLRLFASFGTAFKAPSLSERFETSFFNVGSPDLKPEQSHSWELGADWDVAQRIRVGASIYSTRIRDLIEYDFGALQNINIGRAAIDGAEAYLDAAPTSWSDLRIAYSYTDARDDDTGAPLARRPRNSWRLDARVTPMSHLSLALSWTFVGARTDVIYDNAGAFVSGAGRFPSFNVGALSATYDLTTHAQLFARIDNITDETYEQPSAFAGAPRSGTIGLRWR